MSRPRLNLVERRGSTMTIAFYSYLAPVFRATRGTSAEGGVGPGRAPRGELNRREDLSCFEMTHGPKRGL